MSYRDIRNFTEMLRALGYPHLVSMESFRIPNFPLVADLLVWLSRRVDPDADIPADKDTESERIALIRSAAQFMAIKANVKLNTKRLYQADGYAVKELLKITTLLYDALQENAQNAHKELDDDESEISMRDFDVSDKVTDIKQTRQLASEITSTGASLFDLLGKEADLKTLRHTSAARQLEVNDVEEGVKKAVENVRKEITETKQLIENISATEASLDAKIERRKVELERYEKRLQTLKKVRPAFLEEFTALETQLQYLFAQYSVRVRCLAQLERAVMDAERIQAQREQQAASERQIQSVPLDRDDLGHLIIDESPPEPTPRADRPRPRTGGRAARPTRSSKLSGSRGEIDEESSGSSSSVSDSEELILDGDIGASDDDDSIGLELSDAVRRAPSARNVASRIHNSNSDEDF